MHFHTTYVNDVAPLLALSYMQHACYVPKTPPYTATTSNRHAMLSGTMLEHMTLYMQFLMPELTVTAAQDGSCCPDPYCMPGAHYTAPVTEDIVNQVSCTLEEWPEITRSEERCAHCRATPPTSIHKHHGWCKILPDRYSLCKYGAMSCPYVMIVQ